MDALRVLKGLIGASSHVECLKADYDQGVRSVGSGADAFVKILLIKLS